MPTDTVNHPPHYSFSRIEPIDVIEKWGLGFCLGNCLKYVARSDKKHDSPLEDFKKALWYAKRANSRARGEYVKALDTTQLPLESLIETWGWQDDPRRGVLCILSSIVNVEEGYGALVAAIETLIERCSIPG
jgi:hypothetical protein